MSCMVAQAQQLVTMCRNKMSPLSHYAVGFIINLHLQALSIFTIV